MGGGVCGQRGACMAGGMCGRGVCMAGGCMVGGMCGRGGMRGRGVCMAGGCMGVRGREPPDTVRYGRSMRGRYASYWNIT